MSETEKCKACSGTGIVGDWECLACNGLGEASPVPSTVQEKKGEWVINKGLSEDAVGNSIPTLYNEKEWIQLVCHPCTESQAEQLCSDLNALQGLREEVVNLTKYKTDLPDTLEKLHKAWDEKIQLQQENEK